MLESSFAVNSFVGINLKAPPEQIYNFLIPYKKLFLRLEIIDVSPAAQKSFGFFVAYSIFVEDFLKLGIGLFDHPVRKSS